MCKWGSENWYSIVIFHPSKLWKAKFSILCDVILLVRLHGKCNIDHFWKWKGWQFVSGGRSDDLKWMFVVSQIFSVFGVDLTTLVKLNDTKRPFVVDICVKEVEKRGNHAVHYCVQQNHKKNKLLFSYSTPWQVWILKESTVSLVLLKKLKN